MASVHEQLIDATVSAVQALGITVNGAAVPVEKRKMPGVEDQLSSLPVIMVTSDPRPAKDEPFSTGGAAGPESLRERLVEVVLATSSNREPRKGLGDLGDFQQRVARRFGKAKPLAVAELYDTKVDLGPLADPEAFSKLYDYSRVGVTFACIEPSYQA